MKFEEIKLTIAKIQFENLHLNADKNAIEANPSTHKIAEWVRDNFVPTETLVMPKIAEEKKCIWTYYEENGLYKTSCGKFLGWGEACYQKKYCGDCGGLTVTPR